MGLLGTQISVGLQYLNELMFVWGAVQPQNEARSKGNNLYTQW